MLRRLDGILSGPSHVPPRDPLDAVRMDGGWINETTGVGLGYGKTNFHFPFQARIPYQTLSNLFYGNAYAARIVECVPAHALLKGFNVKTGNATEETAIETAVRSHNTLRKFRQAWTFARLYGGAVGLLGADDGRNPSEPIDMRNISTVRQIAVVTPRELTPIRWYQDATVSTFGEPDLYQLTRSRGTGVQVEQVHATRLIRLDGALAEPDRRAQNNWWSESVLQRVYPYLQAYEGIFGGAATLVQESSQGVFSVQGLWRAISQDKQDEFRTRLKFMDLLRSMSRSIVIDSTEKYERVVSPTSGLADLLREFMYYLSAAVDVPVAVFMGQSPSGLNATGESDMRQWDNRVGAERENDLKPQLLRWVRVLCAAHDGPTGGVIPEHLDITFPPLRTATPTEQADIYLKTAQADQIYLATGVVLPDEVAQSRFREGGWSAETTIDLDARKAIAALRSPNSPPALIPPSKSAAPQAPARGLPSPDPAGVRQTHTFLQP
jgi:uncharacterized protein